MVGDAGIEFGAGVIAHAPDPKHMHESRGGLRKHAARLKRADSMSSCRKETRVGHDEWRKTRHRLVKCVGARQELLDFGDDSPPKTSGRRQSTAEACLFLHSLDLSVILVDLEAGKGRRASFRAALKPESLFQLPALWLKGSISSLRM